MCVLSLDTSRYTFPCFSQTSFHHLLNPSLEQPNLLNAHPIMNLLFRQLTESRSAPVDEILAQNYQYVSQVHQLCNHLNLKASSNFDTVQ